MPHRFRLVAALNVVLWLATLVLPLAANISAARAAVVSSIDAVHSGCQLTAADDDFNAKRNAKRKLPPLAASSRDRGPTLLIELPRQADGLCNRAAIRHGPSEHSQTATARHSVVFEACGPPVFPSA